jgi:hypothetical protein
MSRSGPRLQTKEDQHKPGPAELWVTRLVAEALSEPLGNADCEGSGFTVRNWLVL